MKYALYLFVRVCLYLHIGTDPVLHQHLAHLSVPAQGGPVKGRVAVHIHQVNAR